MIHVGVDLHQRFCYMTALEARGKTIQSGAVNNERLALRRYFRQFRGQAVQVAVEACGFWPGVSRGGGAESDAVGVGASATGEGDRFGQVEERSGGLSDAGAVVALRFVAGIVESGSGDAGTTAAGAVAGDAGAAADAAEEPGARGAASAGAAFSGDRSVRQTRSAMAGRGEVAGEGERGGHGVRSSDRWVHEGNRRAKSPTKCRSCARCKGAVADDDSGGWGLFGDVVAGRDWRHRALCRQAGVVQLRGLGAAGAGIGGQRGG